MERGAKRLDNVIEFPTPQERGEKLSEDQKRYWLGEIALHEIMKDEFLRLAEEQDRLRQYGLRMLGMLGPERGLTEFE